MSAKKHTKLSPKKIIKPVLTARKTDAKRVMRKTKSSVAKATGATLSPITALINELATLRTTVEKRLESPPPVSLSDEVDAIRRVLGDIMESRTTAFLRKLVAIRQSIPAQSTEILERIDSLMEDMGAITFATDRLEHLDPVIHSVGREVQDPQLPENVIVATLYPGYRTARGQILTKALVSINRRA